MIRQQQAVVSYCITSWESLSNLWYFYEIAPAELKRRYSIFFDYSIIPSSHLYIHCYCKKNTLLEVGLGCKFFRQLSAYGTWAYRERTLCGDLSNYLKLEKIYFLRKVLFEIENFTNVALFFLN